MSTPIVKLRRPLWQVVVAWNISILVAFLTVPFQWKWPLLVIAFLAMSGHILYGTVDRRTWGRDEPRGLP
jgi:hypothetical protein